MVTLRWKDKTSSQVSRNWISSWSEGVICLIIIACCGFTAGALYRFGASLFFLIVPVVIAVFAAAALCCRHVSTVQYHTNGIINYITIISCILFALQIQKKSLKFIGVSTHTDVGHWNQNIPLQSIVDVPVAHYPS